MNGFVNTLLSVLLSWIRALINNMWTMISSEDGGAFYQFLSAHWLIIVIGLCVLCMLADAIIYFFRWRPDYVWASKWRRLRRRPARRKDSPVQAPPQEAFSASARPMPYSEPAAAFAPLQTAASAYAPTRTWQPVQELDESVFDEEVWDSEEPMDLDWQPEETPAFGSPQPEPLVYFRDVQSGFAKPLPPEQLYAPAAGSTPPEPAAEIPAVHPGLDEETFRQSIGLEEGASHAAPVLHAPVFRPFTVTRETEPQKPQGALQRFAQRARDLMALDDEQKTIRDLQSSVDVSKAFHEPVYPQSFRRDEE